MGGTFDENLDTLFKNGPNKICGTQSLKKTGPFKFFKGCLPQILLGSFLSTLFQLSLLQTFTQKSTLYEWAWLKWKFVQIGSPQSTDSLQETTSVPFKWAIIELEITYNLNCSGLGLYEYFVSWKVCVCMKWSTCCFWCVFCQQMDLKSFFFHVMQYMFSYLAVFGSFKWAKGETKSTQRLAALNILFVKEYSFEKCELEYRRFHGNYSNSHDSCCIQHLCIWTKYSRIDRVQFVEINL